MSYGRIPHYIYNDGEFVHFDGATVPVSAIAQFVAHMVVRDAAAHGGVNYWINIHLGQATEEDLPDDDD